MTQEKRACEIRPRRDNRSFDLISDALPYGRGGTAKQTQSPTQSDMQSFAAAQIML
jgi:hypothetical protein